MADYEGFRERQRAALDEGRFIGIGLGNYVEGTGLGPFEGVTVRVLPSGKVAVATGATNQGQGTRTTLSQIVAEQVGCRLDDIVMTIGDTGAIAQGVGAFASRQAVNAGCSALLAGQAVRAQMIALAARTLGVDESDIDLEDGKAIAQTRQQAVDLASASWRGWRRVFPACRLPAGQAAGLEHTAYYTPTQAAYCSGTHVVEVEVDAMTGGVKILQLHGRSRRRPRHQSADRRRPGAGRRRPRHRQCAAGMDAIRRERAAADHVVRRLHAADGDRRADLRHRPRRDRQSAEPARRQRRRRGRHHSGAGGDHRARSKMRSSPFGVHFAETPLTPERIVAALRAAGAYERLFAA